MRVYGPIVAVKVNFRPYDKEAREYNILREAPDAFIVFGRFIIRPILNTAMA